MASQMSSQVSDYASIASNESQFQPRTFGRSVVEPSLSGEAEALRQTNPISALAHRRSR